jgi:hypothetical protein
LLSLSGGGGVVVPGVVGGVEEGTAGITAGVVQAASTAVTPLAASRVKNLRRGMPQARAFPHNASFRSSIRSDIFSGIF